MTKIFSISIFSNWNNAITASHIIRKFMRKADKALIYAAYNTVPSQVAIRSIHGAHDFYRINWSISFFKACLHPGDKAVAQQCLHSLTKASFRTSFSFSCSLMRLRCCSHSYNRMPENKDGTPAKRICHQSTI